MQSEDLIDLPAPSNSGCKSESGELRNSNCEPSDADSQPSSVEVKKDEQNGEISGTEVDVSNGDSQLLPAAEMDGDLIGSSSLLQVSVKLNESVAVSEEVNSFSSRSRTENGCLTVQDGSPITSHKRDGSPVCNSISGVKKARMTADEQQPSVRVMYNSVTRGSKRKLEQLLQQWSEWHAQHFSSSHVSNEVLESGEETYFPALHVGLDNPSAVSFWMDNQPMNQQNNREFISLDSKSVPLYDRGYSFGLTLTDGSNKLEGGLEIIDASRCFNCGSYNHSLKECPKPRDNVAVNNARNKLKSKRNPNVGSRNPTRYYQDSPRGKYDGLKPGVLDAETRQLLGLGELDPPPWLNRMRELGYPPGYLDHDNEDQPSGIKIFGDEETKEETEDGEILDTDYPELPKKKSIKFPGINAPIPENADERRWTDGPSNRSHRRSNYSSESVSRGQYHEQRRSRDFRDEGPPGCDPGYNATSSIFSPRYGGYDSIYSSHSARGNISKPRSPTFGRSLSDGGRWSPSAYEDAPTSSSYNSVPFSPPNRLFSPHNHGSAWDDVKNHYRSRR
ncbi:Zinc finger CCHC domain-containing protein 8 [Camellia lanceoleosa]|uniref:Zinc finger CCHC domain-containing protein 8 n=1 Tax=Camellia lanceoleosa TaxID=1840588 RepID=A0ACC0HTJ4_9ERIC|nr:Zinc finger CCHC domain-containing protein 8 [Camellia lanceoleosa]